MCRMMVDRSLNGGRQTARLGAGRYRWWYHILEIELGLARLVCAVPSSPQVFQALPAQHYQYVPLIYFCCNRSAAHMGQRRA
jgi:hypothetical protein